MIIKYKCKYFNLLSKLNDKNYIKHIFGLCLLLMFIMIWLKKNLSSYNCATLIPFLLSLKIEYFCFIVSWESKQQKNLQLFILEF